LCALVKEVVERVRPQIQQARCEILIADCQPIIGQWDRYRIEQVFINLLSNALKYGPGRPIRIDLKVENSKVHLTVQDQGEGIAKVDQARIFQQFERAVSGTSKITGLGLGLYIVRRIVEAHDGSIDVESELGHGATFTVTLPIGVVQN